MLFITADLPVNFKQKRLTSILTVDQEREIMRKHSMCHSYMQAECPMCPTHNDKPMEFYCESCETTICGQCMLDDHRVHGRVQASIDVVKAEATDCEAAIDKLSIMTPFSPDSSLKQSCMILDYYNCFDSPARKSRSLTTVSSIQECELSVKDARERTCAFITNSPMGVRKRASHTISGSGVSPKMHIGNRASSENPTLPKIVIEQTINVVEPVSTIGTKNLIGPNNHITAYPFGVCSPCEGFLLATDTKHHLYRVITSTGKCLETVGCEGKGDGQFTEPKGITVDKDGNILVVDGKNPGRIQKFSPVGECISFLITVLV